MEGIDSATWRKSSYSGTNGGNCVEVGRLAHGVVVRDTLDLKGAMLDFPPAAWEGFISALK